MTFRFSLYDPGFNIYVNSDTVTIDDLKDLMQATQYIWNVNQFKDDFVDALPALKESPIAITTALDLKGFIATTEKPAQLRIRGTEGRATIDLFVNGRLREKNIIRHIPTQRIVDIYMYGQIHFDLMDQIGSDPFTSSREGVVDDDVNFKALLDFLKREVFPKIFDDWDKLRLKHRQEGDDENKRKSKKARKARDLYSAASEEYAPSPDAPGKGEVDNWLAELGDDAEFNISAYVDCFLSENLVRKYIKEYNIDLPNPSKKEIEEWRDREKKRKDDAGLSFDIRRDNDELSYLGMDHLAISVEGSKKDDGKPSLWKDAVNFKPIRNAVGHTGLLTDTAKKHLNVTFENIKGRIKTHVSRSEDKD